MIKNLLNADEEPPPGTKVVIEDSVQNPAADAPNVAAPATESASDNAETPAVFEIPGDAKFFAKPSETAPLEEDSESLRALEADIESLNDEDLDALEQELKNARSLKTAVQPGSEPVTEQIEPENTPVVGQETAEKTDNLPPDTLFQSSYTPPSTAETIRNSGLAWSAGIVLFGSVIFMMILGWFADLLLGSSPWGLVGGIVLGGFIGIIQLFRIGSQIYRK